MNTRLYWLHTLSPTHVGIGRGVGYIDLPIDRDGVTGWPIVRASGFKGVWSDHHRATAEARDKDPALRAAFGVIGNGNDSNSGSLIPTDAKLVCLPVRSFRGTFAYVTSPLCLQMLHRTLSLAGAKPPALPPLIPENGARHCTPTGLVEERHIYLEDLDFMAIPCGETTAWAEFIGKKVFAGDEAWQQLFSKRFVVLPDTAFDFLCETGTEVHTRVRINDDTKTVVPGALWTEESLPAESILMGVIQCERVFQNNGKAENKIEPDALIKKFATENLTLQIGGKATIGRGQVRCLFTGVS